METEEYDRIIAVPLFTSFIFAHWCSEVFLFSSPIPSAPPSPPATHSLSSIASASEPAFCPCSSLSYPRCTILLLQATSLFVYFIFLNWNVLVVVFESAGNPKPRTLPWASNLFPFVVYSICFVCLWAIIINFFCGWSLSSGLLGVYICGLHDSVLSLQPLSC